MRLTFLNKVCKNLLSSNENWKKKFNIFFFNFPAVNNMGVKNQRIYNLGVKTAVVNESAVNNPEVQNPRVNNPGVINPVGHIWRWFLSGWKIRGWVGKEVKNPPSAKFKRAAFCTKLFPVYHLFFAGFMQCRDVHFNIQPSS